MLTPADIKERLGKSQSTISRMISDGRFPAPISRPGIVQGWTEGNFCDWYLRESNLVLDDCGQATPEPAVKELIGHAVRVVTNARHPWELRAKFCDAVLATLQMVGPRDNLRESAREPLAAVLAELRSMQSAKTVEQLEDRLRALAGGLLGESNGA